MGDETPTERSAIRLLDVLLAFFAACAVALRPLLPGHGGESNLWVAVCVFFAGGVWLVRMAMVGELRLARTGVGVPLLALLAIAAVSTLRSPHKAASLATLLEWLCYAALFVVVVNLTSGALDRRFVLRVLWASAFAACLYGLFQQFVNLPLLREQILGDRARVLLELGLRPQDYDHLAARASGRIFSTFLLANSFAGFLALVVPGFAGYVLDRLRAGERGKGFVAVSALWLVAALWCLLLTYSKGGWVAFADGAALFAAMLGGDLLRRRWVWVAGAALAGAVVVGALFATGAIPARIFRDAVGSMGVRAGYWRTGWAMATDNLLGGVGLGTFGSHYSRYRWVTARVTQQAHNDYLQVLAELGAVGLAAYLATWATVLWRSAAKRTEPGGRGFPRRVGLVAGIVAFVLTSAVMATFTVAGWGTEPWFARVPKWVWDVVLPTALCGGWLAFYALLGRGERGEPGPLCRRGLVCGLAAFLVHCTVDFDYYEPGVAFTAWVVAAVAVTPRRAAWVRRLRPAAALVLGLAVLLAAVGSQYVLMGAVHGQADSEVAHNEMVESVRAHEEGRYAESERLMQSSRQHYEQALARRPLDSGLRLQYAALLASLLESGGYDNGPLLGRTVALYEAAAARNRASPSPHVRLAELFERAADAGARAPLMRYVRRYQRLRPGAAPQPAYPPAVAAYEAALERDPHRPKLHLMLAAALAKLGDRAAARQHAERALELHARLAEHHAEHVLRLRPEALAKARALLGRTGGGGPVR